MAEIRRRSSRSYGDWSPLLFAAREGIPDLCHILIKRKADIDQKDQDKANPGYTALITAATRGDLEMVTLLVESDADLSAGDRNGKTALILADQRGFTSVAEYLQEKTALLDPEQAADDAAGGEKKEGDSPANAGAGGNDKARRGSVAAMPAGVYKGLQEKANNKEKERLNVAAQLADKRRERWDTLSASLREAMQLEAVAKTELEEALKAQAAIAAGKVRRGGAIGRPMQGMIVAAAQKIMTGGEGTGDPQPEGGAPGEKKGWSLMQSALQRED